MESINKVFLDIIYVSVEIHILCIFSACTYKVSQYIVAKFILWESLFK